MKTASFIGYESCPFVIRSSHVKKKTAVSRGGGGGGGRGDMNIVHVPWTDLENDVCLLFTGSTAEPFAWSS